MTEDNDKLLDFIKENLEANGGISDRSLQFLLSQAAAMRREQFGWRRIAASGLLAAGLLAAACTWFVGNTIAERQRETHLANVLELLQAADGNITSNAQTLSEALLAWQDAPAALDD